VSGAFLGLRGVFQPSLRRLLEIELIGLAAEVVTFGKVLQRTLACKAGLERLLCLFRSTPMMMMCTSQNRSHIGCTASFESEGQRHVAISSYMRLGLQLKNGRLCHEILAREKRATPSFGRWYGKTDKRIGFSSFALLPILIPLCMLWSCCITYSTSSRTSDRVGHVQSYRILIAGFAYHAACARTGRPQIC
jgi:hypothetical protein